VKRKAKEDRRGKREKVREEMRRLHASRHLASLHLRKSTSISESKNDDAKKDPISPLSLDFPAFRRTMMFRE